MDKKDIYEHLARIYWDASQEREKKKKKSYLLLIRNFLVVIIVFLLASGISGVFKKRPVYKSEIALVLSLEPLKINFNFDPAKKEVYALNLNRLDLTKFRSLGFSLKTKNAKDKIAVRVEFVNAFGESSEVYLRGIPGKWQDYRIKFSEFKSISDWTNMRKLAFVVEEWNAKDKSGLVYIDNIRLLR